MLKYTVLLAIAVQATFRFGLVNESEGVVRHGARKPCRLLTGGDDWKNCLKRSRLRPRLSDCLSLPAALICIPLHQPPPALWIHRSLTLKTARSWIRTAA